MPRAVPILTNFTAGELSPKLTGRVDLAKYYNGCLTLENMLIHPHGGASRRPGTYFVTSALYGNKRCRLVPFEFSVTQAYILEFGDLYIRVFKDGGIIGDIDSYTKLLLHCDGDDASAVFTDDGYTGHTVTTHGNVKVDTSDKVFGTGSALFPGAPGDYLSVADHADWFQDTGKFTKDIRLKFDVPAGDFGMGIAQQYVDVNNYWILYYTFTVTPALSAFYFVVRSGGSTTVEVTGTLPDNAVIDEEWHLITVTRGWGGNANDWAITMDGVQLGSTVTDADPVNDFAADLEIGNYMAGAADSFKGRMDEIQVSKGTARETEDFAPYDRPHPVSPTAVNITTPYLESELRQLQFAQSADVLYITHPNHAPRKLNRTSHTDWTLTEIDFQDGPYDDEVTAVITSSAVSGQTTLALSADGTHYLFYDDEDVVFVVGEVLTGTDSLATAKIMAVTNWGTEGVLTLAAIDGTFEDDEDITDSGTGDATVNGTVGDGYLTYDTEAVDEPEVAEVFTGGTSGATGTVRGLQDDGDDGKMVLEMGANSVDFVVGETITGGTSGTTAAVTAFTRAHGTLFTSDDVGAPFGYFETATWYWLEIKAVIDDITATAIVRGTDIPAGPANASKYRKGTWKIDDYSGSVTFDEQRLIFGGNNNRPQTLWGSEGGDYETFAPGTGASNPFTYTIGSNRVNAIRWLISSGVLVVGTIGGEWIARGTGIDEPITPTNIWVKPATTYGSANVSPIKIGQAILFVQRQGRKLREFVLSPDSVEPVYVAPDMTILAEHITRGGIKEMAYQQEPDSIVWTVRADGVLPGMTYNRPQEVIGWHRQITGNDDVPSYFESVAVIPSEGQDQVWVSVRRETGGTTVRYIEYFTPSEWDDVTDGIYVDSALTYEGASVSTLTGLGHLEGETVSILTDKGVHPNCIVSKGEITLNWSVTKAHVGLPYISVLQTMSLEAGQREGTAQGKVKRIHKATVRLYETLGCEVGRDLDNMDTIPFRMAGDPMDALPPLFTGDKEIVFPGDYTKNAYVFVRQQQPLPLTVLAIIPHMATHDE